MKNIDNMVKQRAVCSSIAIFSCVGIPMLGLLTNSEFLQNIGIFFMILWSLLAGIVTFIYAGCAYAVTKVFVNRETRRKVYESMIQTDMVGRVCRFFMIIASFAMIGVGYVWFGVWTLFCIGLNMSIQHMIQRSYDQFVNKNI